MSDKILFVDDESAVLDGIKRMLHREFAVTVALGGSEGLATIETQGPFAVVVSDMRMPGMSGAQFLAQVRQKAPDTIRMLLTGYTEMNAAIEAVNEGNIFRFLAKPCEKELLIKSIAAGVDQYRLITSERDLLEKTLLGAIKVLTEVLSAASPEAFGRSMRITHYVRHFNESLNLSSPWRFEAAASLSQLGCITLNTDLIQRAYVGTPLSDEEQARFNAHPQVAMDLIGKIPRLEAVAWMIGQQLNKIVAEVVPGLTGAPADELVLGAKILKLAIAFDDLRMKPLSTEDAIGRLRYRHKEFDSHLIDTLSSIKPRHVMTELRKVATQKLSIGMVLEQEIRNKQGMLLVAKGQEITQALLIKIGNHLRSGEIDREVMALVPGEI